MNTIDGHVYSHQCQGDECNINIPPKLTEFWPMSDNHSTLAELLPAVSVSVSYFSNVSYIIHRWWRHLDRYAVIIVELEKGVGVEG